MRPWVAVAAISVALSWAPGVASADVPAPQPNTPCSPNFAAAMTWLPNDKVPLVCAGNQWQTVTAPYPMSDRWLSYGPPMKLHGEGLRNASIRSGDWVATPQESTSRCRAEQLTVVDPGVVGTPQVDEGIAGQPLSFRVLPKLFSITMSGYCLWVKAGA
jgi:hypothetical protein